MEQDRHQHGGAKHRKQVLEAEWDGLQQRWSLADANCTTCHSIPPCFTH